MAITWSYELETLSVDNTYDVVFELPIPDGGATWPTGTSATLEITDRGGTHTFALEVAPTLISGRISKSAVAAIRPDASFKMWAEVPAGGTLTTSVPLYAGPVNREVRQ